MFVLWDASTTPIPHEVRLFATRYDEELVNIQDAYDTWRKEHPENRVIASELVCFGDRTVLRVAYTKHT